MAGAEATAVVMIPFPVVEGGCSQKGGDALQNWNRLRLNKELQERAAFGTTDEHGAGNRRTKGWRGGTGREQETRQPDG